MVTVFEKKHDITVLECIQKQYLKTLYPNSIAKSNAYKQLSVICQHKRPTYLTIGI